MEASSYLIKLYLLMLLPKQAHRSVRLQIVRVKSVIIFNEGYNYISIHSNLQSMKCFINMSKI